LSAGVEIGGASVYLAEIATPGHKGFFAAWQSASQQVAVIFAALFGLVLTVNLSQNQMVRWGWRVPLWAGCAIIPLLLIVRRSLTETDVFLARKHRPSVREIVKTLFANWYIVLLGMMLSTLTTVSFYMITAYTPTYGSSVLHLASTGSLMVTLCVGISNFIWVPVMGALSDRIGRRPLLFTIALLALTDGLPGARLDGQCAIGAAVAGRGIVVLVPVWKLQWRHGGVSDRGNARGCTHRGLVAILQPGDGAIRRIYSGDFHLLDPLEWKRGHPRRMAFVHRSARVGVAVAVGPLLGPGSRPAVSERFPVFDVLVAGGGNAAMCAALSARESGATVSWQSALLNICAQATAGTRATSGACTLRPPAC
jgi:MFS family permease